MGFLFDEINNIITVEASQVEVTCQELIDTIRAYEDEWYGIDIPVIANATGKQALGGGVLVGITVQLLNWRLQFEDRAGPDYILCSVSGGNLVAVDENGDGMNPIAPATYVTVVITNASSATLQELEAIQHSSFNNAVCIDVINGVSGTAFPIGTTQLPVNSLADAKLIAAERGFSTFLIIGDITFGAPDVIDSYTVLGQSHEETLVTLISGCSTNETIFNRCTVVGVLTGNDNSIKNCHIGADGITGFNGHMESVLFEGDLALSGIDDVHILDSWSGVPGHEHPDIDMGGAGGPGLGVRNWTGGLGIKNLTNSRNISVDMGSGHIHIMNTVTNGVFVVRGIAKLTDESSGSADVDSTNLVNAILYDLLGITGENTKWSGLVHDANYNLLSAVITQYESSMLLVVRKQWQLTATYDANSQMTSYELKEY